MAKSRRTFLKQGLLGTLMLGAGPLVQTVEAAGKPDKRPLKIKAKRVVMISLDGICVEGFLKAKTPNLDKLASRRCTIFGDKGCDAIGDTSKLDKSSHRKRSGAAWSCG